MNNIIATTISGQLKGKECTNIDNETFYAFLGIPYATPPLDELRFKAPLPVKSWEGIRDATEEGDQCIQKNGAYFSGSEDCLFLNVFTKSLYKEDQELKPVMVYIHGGIFLMGSSSTKNYGPNILMTEDIVLVTINYRVGALGFLSLNDTSLEVPGNAGLKDQLLALEWIQKNIAYFNGNPKNVTIFGQSAGGVAAHYHILSPAAKGLFHKAILQSGCLFCPWAYSDPDIKNFVKYLGKKPNSEKELLDVLRNVSAEDLLTAQENFCLEKDTTLRIFGPVVEKSNNSELISRDPMEIISSGEYNQVPMIFGYTSIEGLIMKYIEMHDKAQGKLVREKTVRDYIPWQLDLDEGSDNWNLIVDKMKTVYESEKYIDNPYLVPTDSLFISSILTAVNNHVKVQQEPIYLYRLSVITDRKYLSQHLEESDQKLGVCHEDDLGYLFTSAALPDNIPKGSPEDIAVRRLVKLWTNFAKFGNPTPAQSEFGVTWKAVEKNCRYFLDIGDELVVDSNPEQDRMELWKEIFQINSRTARYLE